MKVCINALSCKGNSGVRSYFKTLGTNLPKKYPDNDFLFIVNREIEGDIDKTLPNVEVITAEVNGYFRKLRFEQVSIPQIAKRKGVDVIYNLSIFDILFTNIPTIIRIGNMLPYEWWIVKRHKSIKNILRLTFIRMLTPIMMLSSSRTLVMSEPAADILKSKYRRLAHKIVGSYRGVDAKDIVGGNVDEYALPQDYILALSNMQEHKDFESVINAYYLALQEKQDLPTLVIAGGENEAYSKSLKKLATELNLIEKINFTGHIQRNQVSSLVKGSEIVIFPSLVETMPVTLVEAMFAGGAILACRSGVSPAILGDSALYFNPDEADELASQIQTCIEDKSIPKNLSELSQKRAQEIDFSWEKALRERMELFENVGSNS